MFTHIHTLTHVHCALAHTHTHAYLFIHSVRVSTLLDGVHTLDVIEHVLTVRIVLREIREFLLCVCVCVYVCVCVCVCV
jgi:hypothetical protein